MQRWQSLLFLSLVFVLAACTTLNPQLSVELAGDGSGAVTSTTDGVDINCGTTCIASAPAGTAITLSAAPEAGSTFSSWGGACAGAVGTSCTIELDEDKNVVATFSAQSGPQTINATVAASSDDAEEYASGTVDLDSSDLELAFDAARATQQIVGLRFTDLAIPAGATITNAYIQFTVEDKNDAEFPDDEVVTLTVRGEAADNAETFSGDDFSVSSRAQTVAAVTWTPAEWANSGDAGADQQTSNLATIIQEIVNRDNWQSGNAMAFVVSGEGSGVRTPTSFDGDAAAAPQLVVEFE